MGEKQNRSIRVDMDKYRKVKANYSIERILDAALDEMLADESQDITLTLQQSQIDIALIELYARKAQAEVALQGVNEKIAYLEEKKNRLKEEFDKARTISLLSRYYNQFNLACINNDWDLLKVIDNNKILIEKIKMIDPSFNEEKRMERYKALMDSS